MLYIEWDAPDVAGELRRGLQDRLEGARGVHASFWVQDGPRLAVFMVLDSPGMLDAYGRWCRLRMERLAGIGPSRHETFDAMRSKARPGSPRSCGRRAACLSPDPASPTMRRIPARKTKKKAPPPPCTTRGRGHGGVWTEAPVRSVMEALNKGSRKPRAYTTYMTIMSRLDGKGLLERRREERPTSTGRRSSARSPEPARRGGGRRVVAQYGDVALAHFARQVGSTESASRSWKRLAEQS